SPNGRLLATAENPAPPGDEWPTSPWVVRQGVVRLRDARTGEVKKTLRGVRGVVLSLAFSPDGRTLASGGGRWRDFGEVALWDVASGKERLYLHGHREWVECVAYSPDGGTLVSAGGTEGSQGEMKLWELRAGAIGPPVTLRLHRSIQPTPAPPVRRGVGGLPGPVDAAWAPGGKR